MARARGTRQRSVPAESGRVPTGVPGLDLVLAGGLLEGALYALTGAPGTGKTVLANQLAFAHAARGGNTAYVTLLSESHGRLLHDLRSLEFFDPAAVGARVTYVSGARALHEGELEELLRLLQGEVARREATLLVVDGVRAVLEGVGSDLELRGFVNRLRAALELNRCTGVLCLPRVPRQGMVHTMVDGIVRLRQLRADLRGERELSVPKFRGSEHLVGGHLFTIDRRGLTVHPRAEAVLGQRMRPAPAAGARLRFGVGQLDAMIGGGLYQASTTALIGAPGSGKTLPCSGWRSSRRARRAASRGSTTAATRAPSAWWPRARGSGCRWSGSARPGA